MSKVNRFTLMQTYKYLHTRHTKVEGVKARVSYVNYTFSEQAGDEKDENPDWRG
jgi:hypothetical protein